MRSINTEQLERLMKSDQDYTLIDVLNEESFIQSRIPGAVNVPFRDPDFIETADGMIGDTNQRVVVYCAGGDSEDAARAAELLRAAGYQHVYEYQGGMAAWQQAGMLTDNKPTNAATVGG